MKKLYIYPKKTIVQLNSFRNWIMLFSIILTISSCNDFVQIAPPVSEVVSETVFADDGTAISAIQGIYSEMNNGARIVNGGTRSVSFITALSSDELLNVYEFNSNIDYLDINNNSLNPVMTNITVLWDEAYTYIYYANSVLEGLANSDQIRENTAKQLTGEAKFIRAFFHFYLVNLFGDIPYISTTDYLANNVVKRDAVALVYEKIIQDLTDAQALLAEDYSYSGEERVQPNQFAATALLARTYLYTKDWAKAETEASKVIQNTGTYELEVLNNVFLKNNSEAIWQLMTVDGHGRTEEASTYIPVPTPRYAVLTDHFVKSFENGDSRRSNWIDSMIYNEVVYYFPFKYKVSKWDDPITEYTTILRLAEQYLIRAEARAQQGNITGAQADLNMIRNRAGLENTTATDQASLLLAIEHERRIELFTEWGHRWFDLIRTGKAGAVLSGFGTKDWQETDMLYPIPQSEIENNLNITQNPGYN